VRLFPKSLSGQIALVMASALLVASAVNFIILMSERYRAGIAEQTGPAIARFVDLTSEVIENPPPELTFGRGGARFALLPRNQVDVRGLPRNRQLEARLTSAFEQLGVPVPELSAATTVADRPPMMRGRGGPGGPGGSGEVRLRELREMRDGPGPGRAIRGREIVMSAQIPDGRWLNVTVFSPMPPTDEIWRLFAGTFITFAFVLGAALWIARRLSQPLRDLTAAAAKVGAGEPQEVQVRGPGDVQQTVEAFNAMNRRVSQLLGEKDVMLGALGHDLRTPLASLRIRIETMEPEAERQKAIRTIEEASQLLEDILELARQGRSSEPVQTIDISVLVQDIVEDYAETGAPVTLTSFERSPVACRPVLFRRALRNLIDNAISYGKAAQLSVSKIGADVLVRVEDEGPGMSEEALVFATRPFMRGDASRSRQTGGAGLGLTLADAIVKTHGGSLELANRKSGGLAATIKLPLAALPKAS
jgi:signal transduction histidine kinase